jgi:WD40 repeat protein
MSAEADPGADSVYRLAVAEHSLLVVERDNTIALLQTGPGRLVRSVIASEGFWPVWNPRRPIIAYAAIARQDSGVHTVVHTVGLDGRELGVLHRSPAGVQPIIGPRLPAYSLWSPDGSVLATVGTSSEGLTLYLSDADGAYTSDGVVSGAPVFPTWSPDGSRLAVHTGGKIAVVTVSGMRRTHAIPESVAGFRTPAWSPDGEDLVFATPGTDGVRVVRSDPDGRHVRPIADFRGAVALAFRPGTRELTVAVTASPETGMFDRLWVLNVDEPGARRLIAKGPFASYLWSPTGDRIVLVVPAQTGDGRYVLHCRLSDGAMAGVTEAIVPAQDYRSAIGFFDQYAVSHRFWSPDGESFLFAGRLPADAVSGALGDPIGSYVMRWNTGRGAPLELVAPGEIAFFPGS